MGDLQEQKTSFDHLSSCDYPILLKLKIYNLMHGCSSLKKFHFKKPEPLGAAQTPQHVLHGYMINL